MLLSFSLLHLISFPSLPCTLLMHRLPFSSSSLPFFPHRLLFRFAFIKSPMLFQLFIRKALEWLIVVRKPQLWVRSIVLGGALRRSIQLIPPQGLYNLSLALLCLCAVTPVCSVLSKEATKRHSCLSRGLRFPTTAGWGTGFLSEADFVAEGNPETYGPLFQPLTLSTLNRHNSPVFP